MNFSLVPNPVVLPLKRPFAARTRIFLSAAMFGVGVFGEVFGEFEGPGALGAFVLMCFGCEVVLEQCVCFEFAWADVAC